MILFNYENALVQSAMNARTFLALRLGFPPEWLDVAWNEDGGRHIVRIAVAAPADARNLEPGALFWTLSKDERVHAVRDACKVATDELAARVAEFRKG